MSEEIVILSPEQEKIILDAFQTTDEKKLSITELVQLAFPSAESIDGRSKEGRAIKNLLANKGLKAETKTVYSPVDRIELSDNQKEFINSNKIAMPAVEMAKILFNNTNLSNLHIETRSVAEYLRAIQSKEDIANVGRVDVPAEEYRAPRTTPGALLRIDKYVFNHGINKEQMTAQQKAGLEALLAYLNIFRFVNQINLYETQTARDLFESSFVRYTYDKPDLTEEEVDQYINVSHDNVAMAATQTRVERLSAMLDESTGNNADERARISMALVEAIGSLNTELNQVAKRQQGLLGDLKQKRSDRLAAMRSANASILNLVQLWKEEKTRKKLIHLAEARKKIIHTAATELDNMEEIKARIMGLDMNAIING
jgi:hypothetical protein